MHHERLRRRHGKDATGCGLGALAAVAIAPGHFDAVGRLLDTEHARLHLGLDEGGDRVREVAHPLREATSSAPANNRTIARKSTRGSASWLALNIERIVVQSRYSANSGARVRRAHRSTVSVYTEPSRACDRTSPAVSGSARGRASPRPASPCARGGAYEGSHARGGRRRAHVSPHRVRWRARSPRDEADRRTRRPLPRRAASDASSGGRTRPGRARTRRARPSASCPRPPRAPRAGEPGDPPASVRMQPSGRRGPIRRRSHLSLLPPPAELRAHAALADLGVAFGGRRLARPLREVFADL